MKERERERRNVGSLGIFGLWSLQVEGGGTMLFKICLKVRVNLDQPSLQARYLHQLKNLCTRKVTSKGAAGSRNLERMQLNKMYM